MDADLSAAVGRLAWPADKQIDYLNSIGVGGLADELALEFDRLLDLHRADFDRLGPAGPALMELDRALERMSGRENAELWTDLALKSAPEWRAVRALASLVRTRLPG